MCTIFKISPFECVIRYPLQISPTSPCSTAIFSRTDETVRNDLRYARNTGTKAEALDPRLTVPFSLIASWMHKQETSLGSRLPRLRKTEKERERESKEVWKLSRAPSRGRKMILEHSGDLPLRGKKHAAWSRNKYRLFIRALESSVRKKPRSSLVCQFPSGRRVYHVYFPLREHAIRSIRVPPREFLSRQG